MSVITHPYVHWDHCAECYATFELTNFPNPGSDEALDAGCLCPVIDNGHGRRPPIPPGVRGTGPEGGWYITVGCPVHSPEVAS